MKVFPATDSQRRALENGKAVTVWERDVRLEGAEYHEDLGGWVRWDKHGIHDVDPPYAPGEVLAVGEELVFAHFGDGHQEPLESSLDYASDGAGIAHWIQCGKPPWNWSESWVGSVPWHELADEEDEDWIPADRMPLEAARLWVRVESVEPMTGYDTPVGTISTTLPGDDLEGWACTLTPCNKDGSEM